MGKSKCSMVLRHFKPGECSMLPRHGRIFVVASVRLEGSSRSFWSSRSSRARCPRVRACSRPSVLAGSGIESISEGHGVRSYVP